MDDGAVETEASWSPTGQWHILCYSVTRCYILGPCSGPSVRSHIEPPDPVALTGMERVTCRTLGSTLFEVGANTDDDDDDDDAAV